MRDNCPLLLLRILSNLVLKRFMCEVEKTTVRDWVRVGVRVGVRVWVWVRVT